MFWLLYDPVNILNIVELYNFMNCMLCELYLSKVVIFFKGLRYYKLTFFSDSAHPLVGFYLEKLCLLGQDKLLKERQYILSTEYLGQRYIHMGLLFVQLIVWKIIISSLTRHESYFPGGKFNIILEELRRIIHPKYLPLPPNQLFNLWR